MTWYWRWLSGRGDILGEKCNCAPFSSYWSVLLILIHRITFCTFLLHIPALIVSLSVKMSCSDLHFLLCILIITFPFHFLFSKISLFNVPTFHCLRFWIILPLFISLWPVSVPVGISFFSFAVCCFLWSLAKNSTSSSSRL